MMGASPFPPVSEELLIWVVGCEEGEFSDPEKFVGALDHAVGSCSELFGWEYISVAEIPDSPA